MYFISFFLFQVPRGNQAGAYDSLQPQKCPRCSHYGPIKAYTCHDCRSNATRPHAEGGVAVKGGHVVDSCGSARQMSCHGPVRCHWPHGTNKGGTQKPTQHHVVTVRCVWGNSVTGQLCERIVRVVSCERWILPLKVFLWWGQWHF